MKEYNLKGTYEPRSLDEVVGEIKIEVNHETTIQEKLLKVVNGNVTAAVVCFFGGILIHKIGVAHYDKEVYCVGSTSLGGIMGSIMSKRPSMLLEIPGAILGSMLGYYVSQHYL